MCEQVVVEMAALSAGEQERTSDDVSREKEGWTALHVAAEEGDLDAVSALIEAGDDVNALTEDGDRWTALHLAAKKGHTAVVSQLVNTGADTNVTDRRIRTPLHVAASWGHTDVVNVLLQADLYANAPGGWIGRIVVHLVARCCPTAVIDTWSAVDALDEDQQTPLHLAAEQGHTAVVRELIEARATVDAALRCRQTPLHLAARWGRIEVVSELITAHANVDAAGVVQQTPLHLAAEEGHTAVVRELIEAHATVNADDVDQQTPLHYAALKGHTAVVREIIKAHAKVDAAGPWKKTPLHLAAREGHTAVVRELIEAHATVDAADVWKKTPFHLAAREGHTTVVRELITAHATVDASDDRQQTPLHRAALEGHTIVVRELIEARATVDAADGRHHTPLHLAAEEGHTAVVTELITAHATVDAADVRYHTPLHLAAEEGHTAVVRELIKAHAKVDAADGDQQTPLYLAAREGHTAVVRELITARAKVNAADMDGKTPLQLASDRNHSDVIEALIEAGADLSKLGKDNQSKLIKQGLYTRSLVDQADAEALGDIPNSKVFSTDTFTDKIAVKMILTGQSNAGKTSFLRTVKENEPTLMAAGADGRTIGIELTVLNIDVDPRITCYAYDFGGQQEYVPLHQALITPHSFYILCVDLKDLYHHIANDQHFNEKILHFYYTIYQRVHAPILQVVGTKSDLITAEKAQECCRKILNCLQKTEEKEINILKSRRVELERTIEIKESGNQNKKSKFHELPIKDLQEKIKDVELLLSTYARPKLPTKVNVVSSMNNNGIKEWKKDVAKRIFQHADSFPSMKVPDTWLKLSDSLNGNTASDDSIVHREHFLKMFEDFKITEEVEKNLCTHHLRVVGQILFFEHHAALKDTIFLNPEKILNAMSAIFDHNHFGDSFWEENDTMSLLPNPTLDLHKRNFQEHGITSKTVMHSFLKQKGVKSNFDKLIQLMMKIDLCFEFKSVEGNTVSVDGACSPMGVDEECYIIPSLLKSEPSATMNAMWPKASTSDTHSIVTSLDLTSGREPTGMFEQITTRINPHLKRRCDIANSSVGEINESGDTFRFELLNQTESSWKYRMLMSVRYAPGRHENAANFHKVIITRMINILSNYPNVLWDFYSICPRCLSPGGVVRELLPAEATIFASDSIQQTYKCGGCIHMYDFRHGLPISKLYLAVYSSEAFETLALAAVNHIGADWRFLARWLFSSIDDADRIVSKIEDERHESLKESAHAVIWEWKKASRDEGRAGQLLAALYLLQRRDIIDETHLLDDCENSWERICEKASAGSTLEDAIKRVLMVTSREVRGDQWRWLHRCLHGSERVLMIIHTDNRELNEKTYAVLQKWRNRAVGGATFIALITALQAEILKRDDIATKIEEICSECAVDINMSMQTRRVSS